jgi:HK97 family phage portal protein
MNLFGFTIARTKTLERKLLDLSGVSGSRGWWPLLREMTTGGWQRNEEVNVDTVLSNPTLFSCVTLICGDIAKLRPMLVEQNTDGVWKETESAAFSPVLREPNHYQTWIDFAEWYLLSKVVHGNAYALKARDGRGVVTSLYLLDPYRVRPLVAPDGSVFYQLSQDPLADLQESVVAPAREIIHDVMCPLFHPLCGVSPIYAAGFPALQGLNIRGASDKFFKNGSRPGGVLLVPGNIEQTQADDMKANWKSAFSGDNQGDIAILTGGMKYEPMAMTADQSQLVEQLKMTDEDIAKCFHMPRHKVGIGPDPAYNNIEALNQQYYTDCLQKHIAKLQRKMTTGLEMDNVPGRTLAVELDLDDLLLMDTAGKADAASKAVRAGLSYNEVRNRFWDEGPVAGGESPLAQQQDFSLEALAKRDAKPDPFGTAQPAPPKPAPTDATPPDATKAIDIWQFKTLLHEANKKLAA